MTERMSFVNILARDLRVGDIVYEEGRFWPVRVTKITYYESTRLNYEYDFPYGKPWDNCGGLEPECNTVCVQTLLLVSNNNISPDGRWPLNHKEGT
jgi:hypothetical protein